MPELPRDRVQELLRRWADGDDAALGEIFPIYFTKIVNLLKQEGHLVEDGKDLVQEVFIDLDRTIKAGNKTPEKLTYYLVGAARNRVKNKLRRKKLPTAEPRISEDAVHEMTAPTRTALSTLGSIEVRNLLKDAIDRLPDHCRKVYCLRLEGLKEREIAQRLGLALGTVKAYIHEGVEKLREDLAEAAKKMSTWYAQRERDELTPVAILQASQKIPWLYGDPVRLKHFERLSDEEGAQRLGIAPDVYQARLKAGYELLEAELGVPFPDALAALKP